VKNPVSKLSNLDKAYGCAVFWLFCVLLLYKGYIVGGVICLICTAVFAVSLSDFFWFDSSDKWSEE